VYEKAIDFYRIIRICIHNSCGFWAGDVEKAKGQGQPGGG
jgi:hypothetical protein